jgi:two-component system alkaline phosphatase synthesis response regulator PhoP
MVAETKQKVFVVDDDPDIRRLVGTVLERENFVVESAASAAEFFKKLTTYKPDLVVLDLQLPDEDGFGIIKKLRANPQFTHIPIVMLTVQSVDSYKIAGLEIGADDYIVKPFNQGELVARLRAVLRRTKPKEQTHGIIEDGSIKLFLDQHRLEIDKKAVDLSPKEFDFMAALMRSKNSVLSREALCESVWGHEFVENTRTVDVHIGRLRKKLGKHENKIETVERLGYRYLPESS